MAENNWKNTPGIGMLRRTLFLMAVCGIVSFGLLLGRLYKLQITDHERYESLAIAQQLREAAGSPARGTISDRRGFPLAVSASVDNVYASPAEIEARSAYSYTARAPLLMDAMLNGGRFAETRLWAYEAVTDRKDLAAAVAKMLSTDGPYLLECAIREDDNVLPMTPPGMNVNEMMLEI